MTISDLSERELIARIRARLPVAPDWMLVGVGDDAAVVEPERNRVEVLTVDAVVEGIHFDRSFVPAEAIGHRALAMNLSDLAAMGAAPRLALLSMALPAALPLDDFDGIIGGFLALAAIHRLHVAGGNLTRSPGPLMIDVTLIGTVKRRQALTRGGARPGDHLYVSGALGSAAAGLHLLRTATPIPSGDAAESLVARYLRFEPRNRLGVLLSRNRAAVACMDLSDGLADGVSQMAEASHVGVAVEADALPIEPAARAVFERHGLDAVAEAITAGDDYELLIAVRPRATRRFEAALRAAATPVTKIGVCTGDGRLILRRAGGETPLPQSGYDHFR